MPDKQLNAGRSHEAVVKRGARKHDEEAHGGAWKVAFADFCLALMCLFLVMWVMAARDKEAAEAELKASGAVSLLDNGSALSMAELGNPPGSMLERFPMPGRGEPNQRPAKARYESKDELQSLSRMLMALSAESGLASNLQTIVTPYGLRIMLHDTERQGMYVRGSAIPTDRFQRLLRKMGAVFSEMENQMLIVGHTDSVQFVAERAQHGLSNWTLSSNRAMAARAQLLEGGMAKDGILQVVGMADRAPIDGQHPKADVNRRIELLILTTGQSQTIAAMFGKPDQVHALTSEIDAALPNIETIKALRDKLIPARKAGAHAS